MHEENDIKEKILIKSFEMFQQFGCAKVTMEEIASGLGISKKTLYKHFSNKEHLLNEIFSTVSCETETYSNKLFANDDYTYVQKVKLMLEFVSQHIGKFRGPMMSDLQMHFPKIWEKIHLFMKKKAWEKFSILVDEGIKQRLFRNDINEQIVVLMYVFSLQNLVTPEVLAQVPLSADQIYKTLIKVIFEGILTDEGRKKFNDSENEKIKEATNVA
jgi:hypothetical protein